MIDKILVLVLTVLIGTNVATCIYYNEELSLAHKTISTFEAENETKSTKIAKLENEMKSENQKVLELQKSIQDQKSIIDDQKKQIENFNNEKKGSDVGGRQITVEATAYTAYCREGCTGKTATGVDVSRSIYYQGHRVIAVDTSLIPLNSLVKIDVNGESFTAMAIDKGGAIKGHIIDLLVKNERDARHFGRKQATITILREGK